MRITWYSRINFTKFIEVFKYGLDSLFINVGVSSRFRAMHTYPYHECATTKCSFNIKLSKFSYLMIDFAHDPAFT